MNELEIGLCIGLVLGICLTIVRTDYVRWCKEEAARDPNEERDEQLFP